MANRVRVNSHYIYHPNMLDRIDSRTDLTEGEEVRVVNLPGAPKAGTMDHCHVQHADGSFGGLVHVNSLHTRAEYIAWLKQQIAKHEQREGRDRADAAFAVMGTPQN